MTIKEAKKQLKIARQQLEDSILAAIDKAARKHNLDSMVFYFTTTLKRNGKEVESKEIEKLENVYLEEINGLSVKDC